MIKHYYHDRFQEKSEIALDKIAEIISEARSSDDRQYAGVWEYILMRHRRIDSHYPFRNCEICEEDVHQEDYDEDLCACNPCAAITNYIGQAHSLYDDALEFSSMIERSGMPIEEMPMDMLYDLLAAYDDSLKAADALLGMAYRATFEDEVDCQAVLREGYALADEIRDRIPKNRADMKKIKARLWDLKNIG